MNRRYFTFTAAAALLSSSLPAGAQRASRPPQEEWDRMLAAATAVRNADSAQAAFASWQAVAQKVLPHLQMTALMSKVSAEDKPQSIGDVRRVFSTVPSTYPVGGWKHLSGSDWSRHVLERQQVLVASGADALAKYFPDHELLRSLGTRTLVNVPVVVCRKTVGAFAFLCAQDAVEPEVTVELERMASVAASVFLMPGASDT